MSDEPLMNVEKQPNTAALLFRNLVFTILQPGLVAGLIPYYLMRNKAYVFDRPWQASMYAGIILISMGAVVTLRCILQFALEGKGTLSPLDPTKRLVVSGLYRFSRNPMYVGVMAILIGEAIVMRSVSLWIYLVIVFVCFNLFIFFHEEPRLRKDFGADYLRYCRKVRRWM